MSDFAVIVSDVYRDPFDRDARGILADWLEEAGDPRAAKLRQPMPELSQQNSWLITNPGAMRRVNLIADRRRVAAPESRRPPTTGFADVVGQVSLRWADRQEIVIDWAVNSLAGLVWDGFHSLIHILDQGVIFETGSDVSVHVITNVRPPGNAPPTVHNFTIRSLAEQARDWLDEAMTNPETEETAWSPGSSR